MHQICLYPIMACFAFLASCARLPDTGVSTIKPVALSDIQGHFTGQNARLAQFRLRGPYAIKVQEDYEIRLSTTENISTDLYLSAHAEKAPLVIILHGYDSSKDEHAYQAMHLASWGMHCLTVELPNNGPWVRNGRTLAKLVNFISRWPEIMDNRVDLRKIILVGHSFGGSSVAVALAEGARALGGILLDPAAIGRDMPVFLSKIAVPILLLGADERVYSARDRDYFYRFIPANIAEISIKGATHDDAQFPVGFTTAAGEPRLNFVGALTSAAFSLSSTGRFDYAWTSFNDEIESGMLLDPKRK